MKVWQGNQIKGVLCAFSSGESDGRSASASELELRSLLEQIEKFYPPHIRKAAIGLLCRLDQLFITHPPDVKGVWLAGGVMTSSGADRSLSVTGTGYSPADSLPGLIGEIAEAIALAHECKDDLDCGGEAVVFTELNSMALSLLAGLGKIQLTEDRMLSVTHLGTGASTNFPESLCRGKLAMPDSLPPRSEGCAAHVSFESALLSALCEKIERDAIAHWWFAAEQPCGLTRDDKKIFNEYSAACQCQDNSRSSVLLNISYRSWAPSVFAVVSFDSLDGKGVAMGFGCSPNSTNAIARALLEVRQMEVALSLTIRKRQRRESLSSKEAAVIQRAEQIDIHRDNLFDVDRNPAKVRRWDQSNAVATIATEALQAGVDLFCTPLEVGGLPLAVVKIISPQLLSPVRGSVSNLSVFRKSTSRINPL